MAKNLELSSAENVVSHISVLCVLYFLLAGGFLFFAVMVYIFMGQTGFPFLGMQTFSISQNTAVMLIVFFLFLTVVAALGALGMLQWKEWGRKIILVLGAAFVLFIPIGTVVGAYTIWVLTHEKARYYFSGEVKEKPKHLG
ncbi:MAG: hypothetical protein KGJ59_08285 [Bacteroidota bacterium]|nr:hypothetical protein [Bacteroidota bacterium]